jgi:hypothetical protein
MSLCEEDYEIGKNDLYLAIQHLTHYVERFYPDGLYHHIANGGKFEIMIELYGEYFQLMDEIDRQKVIDEGKKK